jgi:hypothetical protein
MPEASLSGKACGKGSGETSGMRQAMVQIRAILLTIRKERF